jgi:hypothetical protein
MRTIIGRTLLVAGVLALGGCLVWAVKLIPAYQKMVRTGDSAGFGLGLTALLFIFLPVAGALLVGGLLLSPPARLRVLWISRQDQQPPEPPPWSYLLWGFAVLLSLGGAAGILLSLVRFIAGNLVHSARSYGSQDLLAVFLVNLTFSLPLLALATLLTVAGRALWRRRGIWKRDADGCCFV